MTLESFRASRAESKRTAVLDAAEASFCKDGFVRTNIEKVSKEAGVSTATLYRYFSNKAQLFGAVSDRAFERLQLNIDATDPKSWELEQLCEAYGRFLTDPKTRSLFRMIVAECGRDEDLADRFYKAFKQKLSGLFVETAERGVENGTLRKMEDPERSVGQLQGMIEHGTIMRGLVRGDEIGSVEEAMETADAALTTWLARWSV
ncbi:MAG: TetR/AcrR family transcriptional regulator [Pseudomonadota bacterium]